MPERISQINIRESFKKNGIPAEDGPGINTLPVDPTILLRSLRSDLSDGSDESDEHSNHAWLFTAAFSPGPSTAAAPGFPSFSSFSFEFKTFGAKLKNRLFFGTVDAH